MSMKTILFLLLAGATTAMAAEDAGETVTVALEIENAAGEPAREFRKGDSLRFVFRVRNDGNDAVRLATTFPAHDVVVLQESGEPAWQAWSGRMFPQVMRVQEIAAGESAEFAIDWRLETNDGEALPAGTYLVRPAFRAFIGNRAIAFDAQVREITIQ